VELTDTPDGQYAFRSATVAQQRELGADLSLSLQQAPPIAPCASSSGVTQFTVRLKVVGLRSGQCFATVCPYNDGTNSANSHSYICPDTPVFLGGPADSDWVTFRSTLYSAPDNTGTFDLAVLGVCSEEASPDAYFLVDNLQSYTFATLN